MFHSQFKINTKSYVDNNNFMRLNVVRIQDQRYQFLKRYHYVEFFDITQSPQWISDEPFEYTNSISLDGINYKKVYQKMLYGSFFFLSEDMVHHNKDVQTLLDILS